MDSRKTQRQAARKYGVYLRLTPDMRQKISVVVDSIKAVHRDLGLPKTEVDQHDVLVDLVERGFDAYQKDTKKLY